MWMIPLQECQSHLCLPVTYTVLCFKQKLPLPLNDRGSGLSHSRFFVAFIYDIYTTSLEFLENLVCSLQFLFSGFLGTTPSKTFLETV